MLSSSVSINIMYIPNIGLIVACPAPGTGRGDGSGRQTGFVGTGNQDGEERKDSCNDKWKEDTS